MLFEGAGGVTHSCRTVIINLAFNVRSVVFRTGESWDPGLPKGISTLTSIFQDLKADTPGSWQRISVWKMILGS